jgi:segregation and condensation protein A
MQWVLILVAKVQGKEITELPKDLYIPPDAMLVILEMFEGPLDLLLYLIRKHNLNIVDIPVASITKQYVEYVDYMQCVNLELASDYLEMAAILAEIKSRMLLPVLPLEHSEEDPRAELVRRLQEYEQIKQAAANLDVIPRQERDFFLAQFNVGNKDIIVKQPQIKFQELLLALEQVLKNQDLRGAHTIVGENLSVRDKMTAILSTLQSLQSISFADQEVPF